MPSLRLILVVVFWLASTLVGCHNVTSEHCPAMIPAEHLPPGWTILPSSMMPPIDKTPWWHKNPQLLIAPETRQIDEATAASRIWAAIYGKGDDRVVVFCFICSSPQDALAEYGRLIKEHELGTEYLGRLRAEASTVVLVSLQDCQEREPFIRFFESICEPRVPGS